MKISDNLNILSQIINFFLFLFLVISGVSKGSIDLTELIILGYGLLASLIVSIISQIEKVMEK